jgi:hypothetical protein
VWLNDRPMLSIAEPDTDVSLVFTSLREIRGVSWVLHNIVSLRTKGEPPGENSIVGALASVDIRGQEAEERCQDNGGA